MWQKKSWNFTLWIITFENWLKIWPILLLGNFFIFWPSKLHLFRSRQEIGKPGNVATKNNFFELKSPMQCLMKRMINLVALQSTNRKGPQIWCMTWFHTKFEYGKMLAKIPPNELFYYNTFQYLHSKEQSQ